MFISNEKYEIKISKAPHYSINSSDNKQYDLCIKVCEDSIINEHYSSYAMEITSYETTKTFSIVLLCSYCTGICDNSGILMDNIFYVVLDNRILEINLSDYTYMLHEISRPFGAYYEIYKT